MTRLPDFFRSATQDQVVGVAAQVTFAAPALVASIFVSRWSGVAQVADWAVALSVTSTVFSAASFGLTAYLALFGIREFSQEVFWINRVVSTLAGAAVASVLLVLLRTQPELTLACVLLKSSDALADVTFGLNLLSVSPNFAMRRLLQWSVVRVLVFSLSALFLHLWGVDGRLALMIGAISQFVLLLPWKASRRIMLTRQRVVAAVQLGRAASHLSVASTMCGLFVTMPRLLAPHVVPASDLGYVGVAFVASGLVGMVYNVAWLRLASSSRNLGTRTAVGPFLAEGSVLGLLLLGGLWLARPWAARFYAIRGPRFGQVLMLFGAAYIMLYFVMSMTNLLKLASMRLTEARAYLISSTILAAVTLGTGSLISGLYASTLTLALLVYIGIRSLSQRDAS